MIWRLERAEAACLVVLLALAAVFSACLAVKLVASEPDLCPRALCGGRPHHPELDAAYDTNICFSKRRIVFAGDSTMGLTTEALKDFLGCHVSREASRCGYEAYFGVPAATARYAEPVPLGVGPTSFGRKNRGCQDCSGCFSFEYACPRGDITVEFIGFEFAKDVEYPTALSDFTQESVLRGYFAKMAEPPYAFVFNSGLHDLSMPVAPGPLSIAAYEANLAWLAALVKETLGVRGTKLLWVSTSAVYSAAQPPGWRNITSNTRVREFNAVATRIMQRLGIPELDVYGVTSLPFIQELSKDGVHMGNYREFYYRYAAVEMVKHVCDRGLFSKPGG
jgi:hypothetical protein